MRLLAFAVAIVVAQFSAACHAAEGVYGFTDEKGEVHLTNVPDDARYQSVFGQPASIPVKQAEVASPTHGSRPITGRPFNAVVEQVAGRYGIEPALLHAVISVESGYNPKAVSKRGAAGLMQLMPDTARRYSVNDVFDPGENIRAGAHYLSDLLKMFDNDLKLAIAAYNAGENAVLKYGKRIPPFRETIAYVPKVVDSYYKLR